MLGSHLDEIEAVSAALLLCSGGARPFDIGEAAAGGEGVGAKSPRAQICVLVALVVVPASRNPPALCAPPVTFSVTLHTAMCNVCCMLRQFYTLQTSN